MTPYQLISAPPAPPNRGFWGKVCVCVCWVSLLWLQSVYRLQVMPGLDKRSPIPARCLDQFVTRPEKLDWAQFTADFCPRDSKWPLADSCCITEGEEGGREMERSDKDLQNSSGLWPRSWKLHRSRTKNYTNEHFVCIIFSSRDLTFVFIFE